MKKFAHKSFTRSRPLIENETSTFGALEPSGDSDVQAALFVGYFNKGISEGLGAVGIVTRNALMSASSTFEITCSV
jgi:hypothetical protein